MEILMIRQSLATLLVLVIPFALITLSKPAPTQPLGNCENGVFVPTGGTAYLSCQQFQCTCLGYPGYAADGSCTYAQCGCSGQPAPPAITCCTVVLLSCPGFPPVAASEGECNIKGCPDGSCTLAAADKPGGVAYTAGCLD